MSKVFAFSTVRGGGYLSAALLALFQGMDAQGARACQKHRPISATGEWPVGGRRWEAGMERISQAVTSINEGSLLVCSKERRNSGARHAVHVNAVPELLRAEGVAPLLARLQGARQIGG